MDIKGFKSRDGEIHQYDYGALNNKPVAGLYYTPVVTQPTADTMKVEFRPSVSGAPIPNPVVVQLPTGSSDSGENPTVELDTTLTQSGKAADAKAVGDKFAELTGTSLIEPAWGDIPKIFFGAPLQQTKDEIVCEFWYFSKTLSFHCYVEIKAQGNSTLKWPKKNQTVKLFKDAECTEKLKVDFKGWGKQNKFVIKAYWNDITQTRDIVSVRLESDCAKTRSDYAEMPEELRTSPNMGAVDGFPVLVWADGIYQGRYMWNIPKDKWMNNMDDELETHCMLVSEDYNSGCFRAAANIDGTDWTDEIHDTVPASIKDRWNEIISFVQNSTNEEFRANLGNCLNVNSLIDRHLVGLYSCDYDGYGKNQRYDTYDGLLWYAVPYDKDGTWGVYWDGSKILPSNYGREQYEDFTSSDSDGSGNLLFIRLEQIFWQRLQTRWAELKFGPLSIPNTINRFRELYDITPPHIIAEDYASTTANGAFTAMPQVKNLTAQQFQKFVVERHAWMDEYVAALTGESGGGDNGGTEVTLSSISATYSGGDVDAGTAVSELTGIVVTAHYSDGSSETVTGYTLSGTIAEGANTITVTYGGMTTTFTVTGIAEATEEYLYQNYSPNGESFKSTVDNIDFANGDYIEVSIDTANCNTNSENVISIGGDISVWATTNGVHNLHVYYLTSDSLKFQRTSGSGSSREDATYSMNGNTKHIIKLDSSGVYINGEKLSAITNVANLVSLTSIEVGSLESPNRSYATYEYIKVVRQ